MNNRNYTTIHRRGHPLADSKGKVYEHRAVLYESIGDGPHLCHWCRCAIRWDGQKAERLYVAHLDDDNFNNDLGNLVPSCRGCTTMRRTSETTCAAGHELDPARQAAGLGCVTCTAARLAQPTLSQRFPGEMVPVKVLPLSKGHVAIIDPEDSAAADGKWCARKGTGLDLMYATRGVPGNQSRRVDLHAAILGRTWVDHINHDGLDNRRVNLRPATSKQNLGNMRPSSRNTSGFKGVSLHKPTGLWKAQIRRGGRNTCPGYFRNPEDAARCYDHAAVAEWKEFACTNYSLGLVSHEVCAPGALCPRINDHHRAMAEAAAAAAEFWRAS